MSTPSAVRSVPTSVRIAALAAILALLSNLAVIGFIHLRTADDALGALRARVGEEADALAQVYRSGGDAGLRGTIADSLDDDDPQMLVGLIARNGQIVAGNLGTSDNARAAEAGFIVRRLRHGDWLVSGRGFGEGLALQRTLQRSLLVALAVSLLFGLACGLIVARYVGRRVAAIAFVVDDVGGGDLTRRAPVGGSGDAFDVLAARINQMLDRLGVVMEELRLLTDSLAHDLRSPVGRLRARIESALTTTDEAQRDMLLGGVLAEADALMRILSTVLEIGRSEAMAGRERFAWLDPVELAVEIAEMYEPLAEEAGVVLTHEVRGVILPLLGHRQLLAQAMSNLVDNALAYGASGRSVSIHAEQQADILRLGVEDAGPGIGSGDRAEARRRFGRLDASRSIPGAGLGLALVEAVTHLHGGRLELEDAAPGLRATMILPIRAGEKIDRAGAGR